MLTDKEKELVTILGRLMNNFAEIRNDLLAEFPDKFDQFDGDWNELSLYVHQLQNWVMSNSASRSHPDEFRGFGVAHKPKLKEEAKAAEKAEVVIPEVITDGQ